jgi:hypothetical protein
MNNSNMNNINIADDVSKQAQISELQNLLNYVQARVAHLASGEVNNLQNNETMIQSTNIITNEMIKNPNNFLLGNKRKLDSSMPLASEEKNPNDSSFEREKWANFIGDTHPYHIITVFCSKMRYKSPLVAIKQQGNGEFVTTINVNDKYHGEGKAFNKKTSKSKKHNLNFRKCRL